MGIRAMIARCNARADVIPLITTDAAVEIQAEARFAATTPRGNVPLYKGPPKWSADIPITAIARGNTITVSAVDWAMRKLRAQGKPAEWLGTLGRVAAHRLRAIR